MGLDLQIKRMIWWLTGLRLINKDAVSIVQVRNGNSPKEQKNKGGNKQQRSLGDRKTGLGEWLDVEGKEKTKVRKALAFLAGVNGQVIQGIPKEGRSRCLWSGRIENQTDSVFNILGLRFWGQPDKYNQYKKNVSLEVRIENCPADSG